MFGKKADKREKLPLDPRLGERLTRAAGNLDALGAMWIAMAPLTRYAQGLQMGLAILAALEDIRDELRKLNQKGAS